MNCGISAVRIVAAMLHNLSYCLIELRFRVSLIADSASSSDIGPAGFSASFDLGNWSMGGNFVGAVSGMEADDLDLFESRPCRPTKKPSANTAATSSAAPKSFFLITCSPVDREFAPCHLVKSP